MSYSAHALMENRNGLLVDFAVEPADGNAERTTRMRDARRNRLAGQPAHHAGWRQGLRHADFVAACRARKVTPHVAQKSRAPVVQRSTAAPRGIPATRSVNGSANGSKRSSAG